MKNQLKNNLKMKSNKLISITTSLFCLLLFCYQNINAQKKVDTDSLLTVIIKNMKTNNPDYKLNIQRALLGKKLAPDYLDFHLVLGRSYDLIKVKDSARYYYNYVIEKNPTYEDAFLYLINLDIEEKKYEEGLITTEKAIELFPDSKPFYIRRIGIYSLQNDTYNEEKYLKSIKAKFPNDPDIGQRLYLLYSKTNFERVGVYYNETTINRAGVGPWYLASADYMMQRIWGSISAKLNYAKRSSSNLVMSSGFQAEAESYLFAKKNNYHYIDVAYSQDNAFPELRLGYSYYHNFNKGWEADLGARYILMQDNTNLKALNIGLGKYFGSFWVNLRSFIQEDGTSINITSRYYYKTKFDYLTLGAGYGTSLDDRTRAAQYEVRMSSSSYRVSGGFSKMIKGHYIFGLLITANRQEYVTNEFQTELDFAFILQYKF